MARDEEPNARTRALVADAGIRRRDRPQRWVGLGLAFTEGLPAR